MLIVLHLGHIKKKRIGRVWPVHHGGQVFNETLHNALKESSDTECMQHLAKELISLVNMLYSINHSNLYDACSVISVLIFKARHDQSTLLNQLSLCIPNNKGFFHLTGLFGGKNFQNGIYMPNFCLRSMRLWSLYLWNGSLDYCRTVAVYTLCSFIFISQQCKKLSSHPF